MSSYNLPAPRRITASNLPLPSQYHGDEHAEPGVEIKIDNLKVDSLLNGTLMRARVATSKQIPTINDGQYVLLPVPRASSLANYLSLLCHK
jgi:hypothetical protein